MSGSKTWFEYIRVKLNTGHTTRLEVECDNSLEFYALLNYWNRNDPTGWKFYAPCDWEVSLHGKVHKQRMKE
jgi:hypothetical protein